MPPRNGKKTAHFRVDPVFLKLIMKKISNVISTFLLLCVSIVAAAQSTPVSPIGDLAKEDERAAKQYYSVRFTIRTNGEIFATPQATASSGQEVVMVSHSDTPYEFRFKLSDHTQFSAKRVFGSFAPHATSSQMLIETRFSLQDVGKFDEEKWKTISNAKMLAKIDGGKVSVTPSISNVLMQSPLSEGLLTEIIIEVEVSKANLSVADVARARESNANCQFGEQTSGSAPFPNLSSGGTVGLAGGCCSTGCLTCCGANDCCSDPHNCIGGCCT